MNDTFIYGSINGLFQTIIGYPFDTIKTLQQSKFNITMKHLTPFNLYRGVSYPLIQTPLLVGTTFYLNNNLDKYTSMYGINYLLTGFITSFIICPFDEFKIKKQVGKNFNIYNFFKSFNNINIILLREIPATFIYFGTYDYCKNNKNSTALSGAISGVVTWLFTYPIDTVKTQMQGNSLKNFKLILDKSLFNGLPICLIRASIVNGVGFSIYEFLINKQKKD